MPVIQTFTVVGGTKHSPPWKKQEDSLVDSVVEISRRTFCVFPEKLVETCIKAGTTANS